VDRQFKNHERGWWRVRRPDFSRLCRRHHADHRAGVAEWQCRDSGGHRDNDRRLYELQRHRREFFDFPELDLLQRGDYLWVPLLERPTDLKLNGNTFAADVSGNYASGTAAETWNVYVAGTQTSVGVLILNASFTMTR